MSLGFYLDMTRCSGCGTCVYACKNRLDLGMVGVLPRRVGRYEVGTFPQVKGYSVTVSCNHCENPACIRNCPTGAMYKAEDGSVLHNDDACIGCRSCIMACPYGAPQFLETEGIVVKCDTCKALRDADMNPVCVNACPSRALDFGDLDELRQKYGSDLVSEIAVLPDASLTEPNLLIKARESALDESYREVTF